jgi:UDP:flavonoid glycosyltransferase YjiC (YdhE family)
MRFVPYNGPGELPDWVERTSGRPRLCITLGTLVVNAIGQNAPLLHRLCAALADPGYEVIVAVSDTDRDSVGDLPGGIRVLVNLPLELLLPSCAALVHHGGSGTMLTAGLLGLPQAVFAISPEHTLGGEQLAAYGAGVLRNGHEADETDIKDAVAAIRADSVRAAAERLRAEIEGMPTRPRWCPRWSPWPDSRHLHPRCRRYRMDDDVPGGGGRRFLVRPAGT